MAMERSRLALRNVPHAMGRSWLPGGCWGLTGGDLEVGTPPYAGVIIDSVDAAWSARRDRAEGVHVARACHDNSGRRASVDRRGRAQPRPSTEKPSDDAPPHAATVLPRRAGATR